MYLIKLRGSVIFATECTLQFYSKYNILHFKCCTISTAVISQLYSVCTIFQICTWLLIKHVIYLIRWLIIDVVISLCLFN